MRNRVLEALKRTAATVVIAAMFLCGATACSSGGSAGGNAGEPTVRYSDGSVYTGSFQNGKRSGYGTFQWPSGETYIGLWNDDKIDGKGTFTTTAGISWIGTFSNSALLDDDYSIVGNGLDGVVGIKVSVNKVHTLYDYIQTNKLGVTERKELAYDGDLKKIGEFSGTATIGYWNGDIYFGTVTNGRKVEGTYVFRNGDRYNGTFLKDKMHEGVYTFSSGQKLEGCFLDGIPSGRMIYTSSGMEYITTWKNGTCVAVEKK